MKSAEIAREFGLELFAARMDPSDDQDCLNFLVNHFGHRLKDVCANHQEAIAHCGQLYIDADADRARRVA